MAHFNNMTTGVQGNIQIACVSYLLGGILLMMVYFQGDVCKRKRQHIPTYIWFCQHQIQHTHGIHLLSGKCPCQCRSVSCVSIHVNVGQCHVSRLEFSTDTDHLNLRSQKTISTCP